MRDAVTLAKSGTAQGIGAFRLAMIRLVAVLTLLTGTTYVIWRWGWSLNLDFWWISVPLVVAETYALLDGALFAITVWRIKVRGPAPPPAPDATVDVFITTYNEPIDVVESTARAAKAIRWTHQTWILDDGDRPEMKAVADQLGVGYLTRSSDWQGKSRHAKAGNLNNALFQTTGEFLLILDADQIPDPEILERMLGWFEDEDVAIVQSPQWFTNVEESDPLGSQAPLFYGPVQQGKDGWNAAFFCGSNAVLRREALMQLGIVGYVRETERTVRHALVVSRQVLGRAQRSVGRDGDPVVRAALAGLRGSAADALARIDAGEPVQSVSWDFQQAVDATSRSMVSADLAAIRADLAEMGELSTLDETGEDPTDEEAVRRLADPQWSPLAAVERVSTLIRTVDVDRSQEALPVMPVSSLSVTEDMETCMLLHSQGWKSVYHHEILARGLAPEDLGTMLKQRLRWAQGTMQVLLKRNPLTLRGLQLGQRFSYFATMWSYLTGFAALAFLSAPILYLTMGVTPVKAWGSTFLAFFVPYFVLNQLLFALVGYGTKTWRGQQYTLALFPIWIRAMTTAAANVWFGRPLDFSVTEKRRVASARFPVRLIWPQLAFMAAMVLAVLAGVLHLVVPEADQFALGEPPTLWGVGINVVWVLYSLVVLSVIVKAALYRPSTSVPANSEKEQ
ncbi:cellulose synthase (UDP-forming) [Nocardioides sp. YR527]|uniref:glycosyltransferase n=1 Tax=Nocardioides sp. YR527 TaxID=1881028 RepID=UPI000887C6E3|nr:glycosyltransferase [Nocardioides sp. YR527]SDK73762.1 cellulose synthase (UDP-forming) [Nocardioides sp. YR527]